MEKEAVQAQSHWSARRQEARRHAGKVPAGLTVHAVVKSTVVASILPIH